MKNKKTGVIIISALAVALVVVIVLLNPLGIGVNANGGNTNPGGNTNGGNTNPGGNTNTGGVNTGGEGEGEVTNPGDDTAKPTFRISPGKVFLDDDHIVNEKGAYVAGESRQAQILITNLNDHVATFSVDYRVPDVVTAGYKRPTSEVRNWVWISDTKPVIQAGETATITIRLGMPGSGTPPGDKWEFWIGVIDKSQTGFLRVEQGQRWLITMK